MSEQIRRWYDQDPLLSKTMKILKESSDDFQIKMAINLIKIIIEHHIDDDQFKSINDIMMAVRNGRIEKGNARWYDADNTLSTAISMLESCPPEMQAKITKDIAAKIISEFDVIDTKDLENDDEEEQEVITE